MKSNAAVLGDALLASNYRVSDYERDVAAEDRGKIAAAIHRRFKERYLEPISGNGVPGFTRMAVSSLMIEALESFRRGWPDTSQRGQGEHAFCSFFDHHHQFASFRGHARDFYKGVRCGILHQAETTLAWRIRLDTPNILHQDGGVRTINAKKFAVALGQALDQYRSDLEASPWDSEIWESLRKKMKTVCKNCKA